MPTVRTTLDSDGVLVVTLDDPGKPVNVLTADLAAGLSDVVARIAGDPAVRGAILRSGKPGQFVAGADLREIETADAAGLAELVRRGQRLFAQIEQLGRAGKPVVAVPAGVCLGGGLELAMACAARVGVTGAGLRSGMPELGLGLMPGWGGTWRLPRLAGVDVALRMLLTGEMLDGPAAVLAGLMDAVAPTEEEAVLLARSFLRRPPAPIRSDGARQVIRVAGDLSGSRPESSRTRPGVVLPARLPGGPDLPARRAILEAVDAGLREGPDAAEAVELRRLPELALSAESGHLRRRFRVAEAARRRTRGSPDPRAVAIEDGRTGTGNPPHPDGCAVVPLPPSAGEGESSTPVSGELADLLREECLRKLRPGVLRPASGKEIPPHPDGRVVLPLPPEAGKGLRPSEVASSQAVPSSSVTLLCPPPEARALRAGEVGVMPWPAGCGGPAWAELTRGPATDEATLAAALGVMRGLGRAVVVTGGGAVGGSVSGRLARVLERLVAGEGPPAPPGSGTWEPAGDSGSPTGLALAPERWDAMMAPGPAGAGAVTVEAGAGEPAAGPLDELIALGRREVAAGRVTADDWDLMVVWLGGFPAWRGGLPVGSGNRA